MSEKLNSPLYAADLLKLFPDLQDRMDGEAGSPGGGDRYTNLDIGNLVNILNSLWSEDSGDIEGAYGDMEPDDPSKPHLGNEEYPYDDDEAGDYMQQATGLTKMQIDEIALALGIHRGPGNESLGEWAEDHGGSNRVPALTVTYPMSFPPELNLVSMNIQGKVITTTHTQTAVYDDDDNYLYTDNETVEEEVFSDPNQPGESNEAQKIDDELGQKLAAEDDGVAGSGGDDGVAGAGGGVTAPTIPPPIDQTGPGAGGKHSGSGNIPGRIPGMAASGQMLPPNPAQKNIPKPTPAPKPKPKPIIKVNVAKERAALIKGLTDAIGPLMASPVNSSPVTDIVEYPKRIYESGQPCLVFTPKWTGLQGQRSDPEQIKLGIQNLGKNIVSDDIIIDAGRTMYEVTHDMSKVSGTVTASGIGSDIAKMIASDQTMIGELMNNKSANRISDLGTTIALYMPEGIELGYDAEWASEDGSAMRQLAKNQMGTGGSGNKLGTSDIVERVKGEVANFVASGVGKDLHAVRGVAKKNNRSVMFNGVGFRKFDVQFDLVAKNEPEAIDIKRIIDSFKQLMHPLTDAGKSTFWVLPGYYEIKAKRAGVGMEKFGSFYLTSCRVGYGSEGRFSVNKYGPSKIHLTLSFTEANQLDAESAVQGKW